MFITVTKSVRKKEKKSVRCLYTVVMLQLSVEVCLRPGFVEAVTVSSLLHAQKRPIACTKETYCMRKRDLLHAQKRPITCAKETYCMRIRDLLHAQKRPIACCT